MFLLIFFLTFTGFLTDRVYETDAGDSCLTVRNNFGTNGSPIKFAVLSALNPGTYNFLAGLLLHIAKTCKSVRSGTKCVPIKYALVSKLNPGAAYLLLQCANLTVQLYLLYIVSVLKLSTFNPTHLLIEEQGMDCSVQETRLCMAPDMMHGCRADVNCGPDGQSPLPAGTSVCLPQVLGAAPAGRRRLQVQIRRLHFTNMF